MVDHAALRLHFRFIRETNYESVYEFEEFVTKCHARIEDEVVFPKMKASFTSPRNNSVMQLLSRLEADHKLIDTIGNQIKSRTVEGELEMLRRRVQLYISTVESHNSSEESLLFQYWDPKTSEKGRLAATGARAIIQEFGLNRYFRITGISEKLLGTVG